MINVGGKFQRGVWMRLCGRSRWFANDDIPQAWRDGWRVDFHGYTANRFAISVIWDLWDACRVAATKIT